MKVKTKVYNELERMNLEPIRNHSIFDMGNGGDCNNYRIYINKENQTYMCIQLSAKLTANQVLRRARRRLNKIYDCKSVKKLANSGAIEKERIGGDLDFKDRLGGFVSAFEIKNGRIISNKRTLQKSWNRLKNLGFDFDIRHEQICFQKTQKVA